jgi:23S rRNA pseudouridine1911/1915/1917 synthase
MKYIGHTLFGDPEYAGDKVLKGTTFNKYKQFVENCFKILPRQALHARLLEFDHPSNGQRMSFEMPLPNDIQEVMKKWKRYVGNPNFTHDDEGGQ